MKNECNVARDLMPLCIDGVASEESQKYVSDHIAECTECAQTYGAMKVELPRANQEKERAEMEHAVKKLRKKRILRAVIAALLTIVIFIGGTLVWDEMEYRLTQAHSKTMTLDEYSARIVKTQAGNVIVCINLKDSEYLSTVVARHSQCAGINGNTKNVLEFEMLKTIIPQYLDGDDANIQKMTRTFFTGTVINGEWSDPYMEDPRPEDQNDRIWDEVALISGDERKVIYTRGDVIPYCSEEMEAYYEACHEKLPAGKTYPEWRVDLVKLLDAVPERVYESAEEYDYRLQYVCENGDLKLDALYYDVSRAASNMDSLVQTDVYSFPGGNPRFDLLTDFVLVNDGTGICIQYRAVFEGLSDSDTLSVFRGTNTWTGHLENGEWVQEVDDLLDEDGKPVSLPIVRLELHAGDDYVVLWEEGDVLQTPSEAKSKREAEQAKYATK